MNWLAFALPIVLAVVCGCGTWRADRSAVRTDAPEAAAASAHTPAGKLTQAGMLLQEHRYAEAIEAYRSLVRDHPGTDWAASAIYAVATALLAPENPQRDPGTALTELEDYLTTYPRHERAAEARSWRQMIRQYLETRRENERLNKSIEKLRQLDMIQEEKRLGR